MVNIVVGMSKLKIYYTNNIFDLINEVNGTALEMPRSSISLANVLKHADSFAYGYFC